MTISRFFVTICQFLRRVLIICAICDYIIVQKKPEVKRLGRKEGKKVEKHSMQSLLAPEGTACACGKVHRAGLSRVVIEAGAIQKLPDIVRSYGAGRVFLLADENTWRAAGERVSEILTQAAPARQGA